MQPDNYKPKTTIIQANPGFWSNGVPVVAWVIEDGRVARPVTLDDDGSFNWTIDLTPAVRGADE
jgi:hypothetical protein